MKTLQVILTALFMLVAVSCQSMNDNHSDADTLAFDWTQGTDLYEDTDTGAWYLEYVIGQGEDNEFINVYIYDKETLHKFHNMYYVDGEGLETVNDEYCIVHVGGKYVLCAVL